MPFDNVNDRFVKYDVTSIFSIMSHPYLFRASGGSGCWFTSSIVNPTLPVGCCSETRLAEIVATLEVKCSKLENSDEANHVLVFFLYPVDFSIWILVHFWNYFIIWEGSQLKKVL